MSTTPHKPTILILGGGIAGCRVATLLKPRHRFVVKMINPTPFVHYKIGALRAAVVSGTDAQRVAIPMSDGLVDELIVDKAVQVRHADHVVDLASGGSVPYDYLVVATGTSNASPGTIPHDVDSLDQLREYYDSVSTKLASANHVLIVGGGAVGCELAGELRAQHPKQKITITQKQPELIPSTVPLGAKFQHKLKAKLRQLGIRVVYSRATNLPEGEIQKNNMLLVGERTVEMENGDKFDVDAVCWCAGNRLNNTCLPTEWLDEAGQVQVSAGFLVKGTRNVYAVGDITNTKENKMAVFAERHAQVASSNLLMELAGNDGPESVYVVGTKPFMAVPLGPNHGVTIAKFITFGDWMTSKLKSKGLFVSRYWKLFAGKAPPSQ